jgi:hypothetical protein
LRVNINDKLSQINEVLSLENDTGSMLCDGKVIEDPDQTTFAKYFIKNM